MIVLAGFEKFSHYKVNLSEIVVKNFKNQLLGHQVKKLIMPVSWKRSISCYKSFISHLCIKPNLVILLGIHSRSTIKIEHYSWNFSIGIDEDNKFRVCPIRLIPKLRIETLFNFKKINALESDEIRVEFSNFMGFYLCNHIYFNAMLISAKKYPVIFIHIPHRARLGDLTTIINRILYIMLKSLKIRNS